MYYFAYGLNLARKQMLECCPNSRPQFTAALGNYRLIFTGWSRKWRGSMASIKPAQGKRVPGAVYEISDRDLPRLDRCEGYPEVYNRLKVTVYGDADEPVEAITYIKASQSEETRPSAEYLAVIQQGYRDWGLSKGL
jgi:gamma-glutamylcyclotransferase (GGCT)/AIG2-like uncharacterized protein YtfP